MPREVMAARVRLMKNNAGVAPLHPYLVDGPPTAFVVDNDADGNIEAGDGDRVVLYFGMRRGGKSYYALDISDPDSPKLLWSIRKGTSCDPLIDPVNHDFCELGQSWSAPRVARLSIDLDGPDGEAPQDKFVLMFAGGYNGDDGGDGIDDTDPVEMGKDARDDDDPNFTGSDDDEGNAIFMVDALDGSLIWKAIDTDVESAVAGAVAGDEERYQHPDLDDSIPSDLSVIDTDANGYADRFYVGDTSGTIWRGDILGADRTQWTLTKLASVGRHFSNTKADDRRFFHRIDFVRARDDAGDYDGVLIGSGDRAHPLGDESVNYFYLFKDRAVLSGFPPSPAIGHDDVADLTDNCLADGDAVDCSDSDALDKLDVGWRIKLQQCEGLGQTGSCGEKSLARALTLKGTVYFTTYVPPVESITDICSPSEGEGLFYAVDLTAAQPVLNFDQSNDTNGETLERFEELDSSGIPAQLVPLGGGNILRGDLKIQHIPQGAGSKTFWYERYFQ